VRAFLFAVVLVSLAACSGGAKDLLDTARLEEAQNNPTHARELYEEVVRRHPHTPEASAAADRLRALSAPGGE
jgi:TolA-binding protein